MPLILASASPRRAELLAAAGFRFEVIAADVDETPHPGESAELYTRRVAADKARHVAHLHSAPDTAVLAADTEVVVGERIFGKPADPDGAREMLRHLAGAEHRVLTAVVVMAGEREISEVVATTVWFAPMTESEIDWYVATGEPMGKAGGYGIQGRGARFVARIDGSWSNVVGLPIATVHRLLVGIQYAHGPDFS